METIGEKTLEIMELASWYNNWLFSLMEKYLRGEILEIGAGSGNFTQLLSDKGKVTAIDINKEYVKKLKSFKKDRAEAGFGDIEEGKYFFEEKKFDVALCLNVLEHIKGEERALKSMYKLLKKGGMLILLMPAHKFLFGTLDRNLGHVRRYTKKDLAEKLQLSGFKILEIKYLNGLGAFGWFINARILKKDILPESQVRLFDKISRPFLFLEKLIKPPFGLSILAVAQKVSINH